MTNGTERRIRIVAGDVALAARLNATRTADALWAALPITLRASLWGDEIYGTIPVAPAPDDPLVATVDLGAVAVWPPGPALCLFFGRTPASQDDEIRPASPVVVIGSLLGDPQRLRAVRAGASVTVERVAR